LAGLPFRLDLKPLGGHTSGPTVILVHGSPTLNTLYWTEDRPDSFCLKMAQLAGAKAGDVIAFGHTHKPWYREVEGIHFVNAGSVGRPKDGDWRAGYVLLDVGTGERPRLEFVRVEYDVDEAARFSRVIFQTISRNTCGPAAVPPACVQEPTDHARVELAPTQRDQTSSQRRHDEHRSGGSLMGRLAPSGRAFLPELSKIGEIAVAAAMVLRDRLDFAVARPDHRADLARCAREAASLATAVTLGAARALVPPIDGEDATALASRLRAVVGSLYRVARVADVVRPVLPDATVADLADLLVGATDSLGGASATLTEPSRALDFAGDVRRIARAGDIAYGQAMGSLLASAPDSLGAVRQAEIYGALRKSLRDCARAVVPVERIVLKRF
jgi:diadenosine tetraphosphatase ApaH/serine/threonine PP2A family protein phosphatase